MVEIDPRADAADNGDNSTGETASNKPQIKYQIEHIEPDSRPFGVPVSKSKSAAEEMKAAEGSDLSDFEDGVTGI